MPLVTDMRRFYVYVRLFDTNIEKAVAEGVEFSNENVALHEFLTKTILILDSIRAISEHYSSTGDVIIEWVDFGEFGRNVH